MKIENAKTQLLRVISSEWLCPSVEMTRATGE
jgi:hypothetical protein